MRKPRWLGQQYGGEPLVGGQPSKGNSQMERLNPRPFRYLTESDFNPLHQSLVHLAPAEHVEKIWRIPRCLVARAIG